MILDFLKKFFLGSAPASTWVGIVGAILVWLGSYFTGQDATGTVTLNSFLVYVFGRLFPFPQSKTS